MPDTLSYLPNVARTTAGASVSGAKALFYLAGTTTPVTVYTDDGLTTAAASPLVADANGVFAQVYHDGSQAIKVTVTDASDVTLWTVDPAISQPSDGSNATQIGFSPTATNTATNVQTAIANNDTALQALTGFTGLSGAVMVFAMSTAPSGWLECDGAAVSRTTYATLFTAIGTTYGVGDGSTTFNLPDLRGEFVRGWDNGKGTDSGRAIASTQTDQFQDHGHDIAVSGSGSFVRTGGSDLDNEDSGTSNDEYLNTSEFQALFSINDPSELNSNGTPRVGAETRPRNIAMMYCIKT